MFGEEYYMSKKIYYSMIGSRETPQEILNLMTKFATKACAFDYCGRSGGADGADSCLEQGVQSYLVLNELPDSYAARYMEIYLPWKDFNKRDSKGAGYYTLPSLDKKNTAEIIASDIHPAWDRCSQGAKKLHTRNVFQCLGQDLSTPSRFIICWAKPKYQDRHTEECQGGTGTAVKLGINHGVEIINLYWEDQLKRVQDWVNK